MQNYSSYYQPQNLAQRNTMPQQQFFLKGRPVASLDEVRATTIDFDGSVFYFPDLANKRIYTKQIGMDGSALFNMYELKEIPAEQNNNMNLSGYITREEFDNTLEQIKAALLQLQAEQKKEPEKVEEPQKTNTFSF